MISKCCSHSAPPLRREEEQGHTAEGQKPPWGRVLMPSFEGPGRRVFAGGGEWWGIQRRHGDDFRVWNVFRAFSYVLIITWKKIGEDCQHHVADDFIIFQLLRVRCSLCTPGLSEGNTMRAVYLFTFFLCSLYFCYDKRICSYDYFLGHQLHDDRKVLCLPVRLYIINWVIKSLSPSYTFPIQS